MAFLTDPNKEWSDLQPGLGKEFSLPLYISSFTDNLEPSIKLLTSQIVTAYFRRGEVNKLMNDKEVAEKSRDDAYEKMVTMRERLEEQRKRRKIVERAFDLIMMKERNQEDSSEELKTDSDSLDDYAKHAYYDLMQETEESDSLDDMRAPHNPMLALHDSSSLDSGREQEYVPKTQRISSPHCPGGFE